MRLLLILAVLLAGCTTYEDGSAVLDLGGVRIIRDAMDSPQDVALRIEVAQ